MLTDDFKFHPDSSLIIVNIKEKQVIRSTNLVDFYKLVNGEWERQSISKEEHVEEEFIKKYCLAFGAMKYLYVE